MTKPSTSLPFSRVRRASALPVSPAGMMSLTLAITLALAAGPLASPANAALANPKCVDTYHGLVRKVANTQNKASRRCIKDAASEKLDGTIEACLTADGNGKLAKAGGKFPPLFSANGKCFQALPGDLLNSGSAATVAGPDQAIELMHDIFGPDLDAVISTNTAIKRCQGSVAKASVKIMDTWLKGLQACVKTAIKEGADDAASVGTACLSEVASNGSGSSLADPKNKIGKAGIKLARLFEVEDDCDLFGPRGITGGVLDGTCEGGGPQGDVTQCLQDLAECRACKVARYTGVTALDCDLADNGAPDGSCPADCDPSNASECFLPFPSSFYQVPADTDTGLRNNLPAAGMPTVNGDPWLPDPANELDGFSPMVQIFVHFPEGVDLAETNAARLQAAGCCSQPAGPPWIDTRTYTDRSLHADSPTLLLNAETGERILHWVELDARASGGQIPGRQGLFLRPAVALDPATRYIAAFRNLKQAGGADINAEAAFAAWRDDQASTDPVVESRRVYMQSEVINPLANFGITVSELDLAFDFTTQSQNQLTGQITSMRDQAYAWLDTVEADGGIVPFTVDSDVEISDCLDPEDINWKKVSGTFESPLFLDGVPVQTGPQFMNVDANDVPVQNGFMDAPYDILIPCSVFDGGVTTRPMVSGHGIFGDGSGMVDFVSSIKTPWVEFPYIQGGTEWIGLSDRRDLSSDAGWLLQHVIGAGTSQFNNFEALPDRLRQGMLNTLVLARLMKAGIFNRDTAFESAPGVGVFPGPTEEMYYYGISLGGIHGTWLAGLTPDIERFVLDVPAVNFGCLLQRSTQFSSFELLIQSIGVTDPMHFALLVGLAHEVWAAADPSSVVKHITSDPLPGSGGPSKMLYHPGWLDKQVSNQCTEAAARSMGLPSLVGSLQPNLVDIADLAGPLDSALVMWDTGAFDLFNPAHAPHIPPLANQIPTSVCDPHNGPRQTPAAIDQMVAFLQPGGQITNTCNGICDSGDPSEIPGGGACDGSSPAMLQGALCRGDADCGGGTCEATVCDPLN